MKGYRVFGLCLLLQVIITGGFAQSSSYRDAIPQRTRAANNCAISVPNVFTPNGDGINDALELQCNCKVSDFRFTVFSGKGNKIYHSRNARLRWNGFANGRPVREGYYRWEITYKVQGNPNYTKLRGDIAIIRS